MLCGPPDASVAQKPLAGPGVERYVEGGIEERPRPEGTARHTLLAARADQANRTADAGPRDRQDGGGGFVTCHPPDVDPADRRPGRDRPAFGQGDAAERRHHEHDGADDNHGGDEPGRRFGAGLEDGRKRPETLG